MKNLIDILSVIGKHEVLSDSDVDITNISTDSRTIEPQGLYIAIVGTQVDGHDYIEAAILRGARAVLCQKIPAEIDPEVCYIKVHNTRPLAGKTAAVLYGHPSATMRLVGVTGTNGKTTCTTLLYNLLSKMGHKCGLISTVNYIIGEQVFPSTHTTPDPIRLQKLMLQMKEAACEFVFMEVSSHAIDQDRISGLEFEGAVFTNISRDHLDYHHTFDAYIAAKKKFFDDLPERSFGLVNKADPRAGVMLQNTDASKHDYSVNGTAEYNARLIENTFQGMQLEIRGKMVFTPLVGEFNAYNFMACYGVASLLGLDEETFLPILSSLTPAEGRFEYTISPIKKIVGIIDYAHTPDALENVLTTIRDASHQGQQVVTVVGCGGDRDHGKRPQMADIAARISDKVILTSDNPRSENPSSIIDDMLEGVREDDRRKVLTQPDRREAIRTACSLVDQGDIVLVAGKGHEKYQEINGVRHDFDDRQVLEDTYNELEI